MKGDNKLNATKLIVSNRPAHWQPTAIGRPPRFSICKEHFVEITGNYKQAFILNQLLCESENVWDEKCPHTNEVIYAKFTEGFEHDWHNISLEHLSQDTILRLSKSGMRRQLKKLVTLGFLEERPHPELKRTTQHKICLPSILNSLHAINSTLEGVIIEPSDN